MLAMAELKSCKIIFVIANEVWQSGFKLFFKDQNQIHTSLSLH